MWVYVRSEAHLYTVGFYDPTGDFITDSDHESKEEAAKQVAYLNGGASHRHYMPARTTSQFTGRQEPA